MNTDLKVNPITSRPVILGEYKQGRYTQGGFVPQVSSYVESYQITSHGRHGLLFYAILLAPIVGLLGYILGYFPK